MAYGYTAKSTKTEKTKYDSDGCRLEDIAKAKMLPIRFLQDLGWQTVVKKRYAVTGDAADHYDRSGTGYANIPWVEIPYLHPDADASGKHRTVATRYRTTMRTDTKHRFVWETGTAASKWLYGMDMYAAIEKRGMVFLVEGETDTATLRYHDIPVLGMPGKHNGERRHPIAARCQYRRGRDRTRKVWRGNAADDRKVQFPRPSPVTQNGAVPL